MTGLTTRRVPLNHRILRWESQEIGCSSDLEMNLSDTVFEFLEEQWQGSPESVDGCGENEKFDEDEEDTSEIVKDNKRFWENQRQLLRETLCRTSSLESRIRHATKEALKDAKMAANVCGCQRPVLGGGGGGGGCKNCLMREVCCRLQIVGFNCAICKSKWRSSPDIPSGEHTFLDVLDNSNPKKGEVRVIIELNFCAEFEMARASEEYNRLISQLPEVFVGKIERLMSLIKILCSAAKKCMKVNKMHMGPWRRHRYMQAKWIRTCERDTSMRTLSIAYSDRSIRPKASMLTVDLLETLPNNVHPTPVEVV